MAPSPRRLSRLSRRRCWRLSAARRRPTPLAYGRPAGRSYWTDLLRRDDAGRRFHARARRLEGGARREIECRSAAAVADRRDAEISALEARRRMRTVMSISLPEKVAEQLEQYVAESGRNKSDVVRESISLYLWEARLRGSQRRLGARAKKAGIVTEDDALRAIS